MFFRKLLQGEKYLVSVLFSGGTTVKLKEGRPLLDTNRAVHGILCAPEAILGAESISLILLDCLQGAMEMVLLKGLEFGRDVGITLEIPFGIASLLLRTFWSGQRCCLFQRSLQFSALRYLVSIKQTV